MDIKAFWHTVLAQDAVNLPRYFCKDARIRWHCTNEVFDVEAFVRANCAYPGKWEGELERVEEAGNTVISVVRVYSPDKASSFHAVSFMRLENDRIAELDEYWADDGPAPEWRARMALAGSIR